MDSANSGSMQSTSTAGDEEYDSRAESSSISAFLTVPPPQQPHAGPGPFTNQHHHVFDPLSNYLDPTQRSHPLNLDMVWSKVARSEPDLGGLMPCSSSSPHRNQAFLLPQLGGQSQTGGVNVAAASASVSACFPSTLPQESASSRGGLVSVSAANEQAQNSNGTNTNTRNPKKRSRASRRAPTTVLTTDTTNFRAMVQEFTGIPAPPFTSSPFPRTRLDLFASSSTIRPSSTHLDPPPPPPPPPTTTTSTTTSYLLRPFAHKVQPQPSSFPPMLDNNTTTTLASNSNYPLNMHNPILSLQSILQPPPKYPSVDSSHHKMALLEDLGLTHPHVAAHHHNINMVSSSSDGPLSRLNNINSNMRGPSPEWAQAQAQVQTQRIGNNDGTLLRSLTATLNYRSNVPDQRKVNFSATPSDFHGEKGPDCAVAARTEATDGSTTTLMHEKQKNLGVIGGKISGIVSRRNLVLSKSKISSCVL
ncbi:hypothetical protein CR513_48837, partial [Mucuna pruriens]